jgi:hypothetical protein
MDDPAAIVRASIRPSVIVRVTTLRYGRRLCVGPAELEKIK